MTAPGVEAALDQTSAEARNLGEAVARMWLTYASVGMPDDLARVLVAQYHRVACGGPLDPPATPVVVVDGCEHDVEEVDEE